MLHLSTMLQMSTAELEAAEEKRLEEVLNARTAAENKSKLNKLFNTLDANGDGELTKDEVVAGAGQLKVTAEEAAKLFDDLDEDKSGTLTRNEFDAAASMLEEYEKMMAETAELEAEAAIAEKEVAKAEDMAAKTMTAAAEKQKAAYVKVNPFTVAFDVTLADFTVSSPRCWVHRTALTTGTFQMCVLQNLPFFVLPDPRLKT